MRRLVAYELVSLDGVAQDPDTFITTWDDVLDANLADVIATQDTVVLGRRSYDEWAGYWPTSDVEPFATFINGVAKHVATSTPLTTPWANSTVVDGDLAAHVRQLKEQPGSDIGVHASISVVQALLTAGVLDELRLVVAPYVAGAGRRLLDGVPAGALQLTGSTTTPTGHLLLTYRPGPTCLPAACGAGARPRSPPRNTWALPPTPSRATVSATRPRRRHARDR